MTVQIPRQIGSVRIMERLGEGGMAFVHRAEDGYRPDRQLAIKFLRPETLSDAEIVRRFLREGEVMKHLRHPHLVEVVDFGRACSIPYLLMELLPGGSIKARRGEAPAGILRSFVPVLDALAYAHGAGVIHRDLKPSNLLFAADGRLKVTDFGVCMWEGAEGSRATRSQMVVGTVGYMAPEQHGDPRKVDGRCDVYAFGTILYEFTTGQPYSQVQLPPAAVRPGFPPGLAGILMQSLAANPERRTPSMEILRDQIAAWLERAEATGWGEEALPGFRVIAREIPTCSRVKAGPEDEESPLKRLAPYLTALQSGGVGSRRTAADGLRTSVKPGDEAYLLEALAHSPEGARFALVTALGEVGTEASLTVLLGMLDDPFARGEAAESASLVALRVGRISEALAALREPGLGASWRWGARARLGDVAWVEAFPGEWPTLPMSLSVQALGAAAQLPENLRSLVKSATSAEAQRAGGLLRETWEAL